MGEERSAREQVPGAKQGWSKKGFLGQLLGSEAVVRQKRKGDV